MEEARPVYLQEPDEDEEEQNPGAFMWIEGDSLAPPCQSDRDVVDKIVEVAQLSASDVRHQVFMTTGLVPSANALALWQYLMDLGCGDGRICIAAAARFGARARGVEIEEFLVERFRQQIAANQLEGLVSASLGDLLQEDLSEASVIVTYLLPEAMDQLADRLKALLARRGHNLRVICNTWGIRGLEPSERHDAGQFGNVTLLVYRGAQ